MPVRTLGQVCWDNCYEGVPLNFHFADLDYGVDVSVVGHVTQNLFCMWSESSLELFNRVQIEMAHSGPYAIVHQRVRDFDRWKADFDATSDVRRDNGMKSLQILQDIDDPNIVVIVIEWDSLDSIGKFIQAWPRGKSEPVLLKDVPHTIPQRYSKKWEEHPMIARH